MRISRRMTYTPICSEGGGLSSPRAGMAPWGAGGLEKPEQKSFSNFKERRSEKGQKFGPHFGGHDLLGHKFGPKNRGQIFWSRFPLQNFKNEHS